MTAIQPVPVVVLPAPFPTTADRVAGIYNAKAKVWADKEAEMAQSLYNISLVTYNNAIAAQELAASVAANVGEIEGASSAALVDIGNARNSSIAAVNAAGAPIIADASASKDAAAQSEANAAASAAAAQGVLNYKGEWSSLSGPLSPPATVSHELQLWSLVTPTEAVEADEPGLSDKWIIVREVAPIGTVYTGSEPPREGMWLEMDAVYLQASYPDLFAKVGKLHNGEFTWTAATFPFADTAYSAKVFEVGGGNLFAFGTKSGVTALGSYSTNGGASWTASVGHIATSNAVDRGNIAVLADIALHIVLSGSVILSRSIDNGVTWASQTAPAVGNTNIQAVGGKFVAYTAANAFTSTTGLTGSWTSAPLLLDGVAASLGATLMNAVFSEAHQLLVATLTGGRLVTSADGISWTTRRTSWELNASTVTGNIVVFGNVVGQLLDTVSDGAGNQLVSFDYSVDLLTWHSVKLPFSKGLLGSGVGAPYVGIGKNFLAYGAISANVGMHAVLSEDGACRFSRSKLPASVASTRNVGGKLRTEGTSAQFFSASLYPYNDSTQFLTPPSTANFGMRQWIKAS